MENLFILTPKQQRAFNDLKKAYNKCSKLKIGFYNVYGTVGVYDKAKIEKYNDDPNDGIMNINQNIANEFRHPAGDSWADDTHYFHPAKTIK
jgi:hypothetical protein